MTKTKIALAAVLFAATSSAAFAQGYNPNRHRGAAPQASVLQQRNVALPAPRESNYDGVNQFNANRFDHASSPFAGGGGL